MSLSAEGGQLRVKAPPGVLTAKLRDELTAQKDEILKLLGEARGVGKSHPTGIPRTARGEPSPLSFAQERLWFIEQMEPGSFTYNMPVCFRLSGQLDAIVLERSVGEIVRRHEALRTVFCMIEGESRQRICEWEPFRLAMSDLRGLPTAQREEEVRRLAYLDARQPFDLGKAPLIRAGLLKLAEEKHVLLVNMHHIASDAWSLGVLTRELGVIYEAFLHRRPSPLPALPIQYVDFAVWQRQWLQGDRMASQLAYWVKQLRGAPSTLELPTDHPRPAVQTPNGATESIVLTPLLAAALGELSRREGVTLFITLLAAFKALLHRYSGQEDIVVGMPIANRNQAEIEGLIGFFVNTLVLRTDLSGAPTFRDLLGRVREVALGAYAHQDLPFEKLVLELQPARSTSHAPLFQVMFNFWNAPQPPLELPGLQPSQLEYHDGGAKVDLSLAFEERAQGLTARCLYNTNLWDKSSVIRMLGGYRTLLEGIVANPEQRLSDLPLLTSGERHQVLVEWNQTQQDFPSDKCLHELFEEQVERRPEAIAIVFGDQRLTYRELDERANRLARHLQKFGVGPETRVGICVERSLEMVIGLLGILKAGGAYVPLDPSYPKERLCYMLEDARPLAVVTQRKLEDILPSHDAIVAYLDEELDTEAGITDRKREEPKSRANSLAYVLYTSGSTGRPKGVAIEHRSAVAFATWARRVFTDEEFSGVLFSTSICFDVSVFELFATLGSGGKVILAANALELPTLPAANEVRMLNTVPSAIAELLHRKGIPRSVITVNLAGEALSQSLVDKLYKGGSIQKVYDLYGPTETTTYSTHTLRQLGGKATIGRPISNTQIYILDRHLQPVPIGVPGELHIGGIGLARGYHNRPELTAEKFIAHPFSTDPGSRIYKTGDLARYLPDGAIEYLGRLDHQVKLRGFRIELGEIESVLSQQADVKSCIVVLREDKAGDKRLVAYYVGVAGLETAPLRERLRARLPEFMVPSAFVALEAFPLNPNGKVDRKALPAPQAPPAASFAAPESKLERSISAIWARELGLEKVGLHDNFFDIGGHSLLLIRIQTLLQQELTVPIAVADMFQYPTVFAMARHLSGGEGGRGRGGSGGRLERFRKNAECRMQNAK
jgi:amino acid adenylation domain-containing protein